MNDLFVIAAFLEWPLPSTYSGTASARFWPSAAGFGNPPTALRERCGGQRIYEQRVNSVSGGRLQQRSIHAHHLAPYDLHWHQSGRQKSIMELGQ
jgi:hypothetical protein